MWCPASHKSICPREAFGFTWSTFSFSKASLVSRYICGYLSTFTETFFPKTSGKATNHDTTPIFTQGTHLLITILLSKYSLVKCNLTALV